MIRLFISFCFFPLIAVSQIPDKEWITYNDSLWNIEYPTSWEFSKQNSIGARFTISAPKESETDLFHENISLVVQDLTGIEINLDQFSEISEEQIHEILPNFEEITNERLTNKNGEYQKFVYSGTQTDFTLIFEQYYLIIDNKSIILTFTCEKEKYFAFQKTAERILNSFVFKH